MRSNERRLRIGLEVGWDPTWAAGLLYVRNLVHALSSLDQKLRPEIRLLPFDAASIERVRDLQHLDGVTLAAPRSSEWAIQTRLLARRAIRRWIQPRLGKPLNPAFRGLDVTYPGFGTPLPSTPQMQWIPDFQHVHLPNLFTRAERERRDTRFATIAATEGIVVLSSEAAKGDFESLFPHARRIPRVWRFNTTFTDHELTNQDPYSKFSLPGKYIYIPNQFWIHKDHLTVFRALLKLRRRGLKPIVVCTGAMNEPRDSNHVPLLLRFIEENNLNDQVRFLGHVDRRDQVAILRYSAVVLQPSTFEGWSTAVEDAKAVGRPMILSDIAVHFEQAPDATFYRTGSDESLANVLSDVLPRLTAGPDPEVEGAASDYSRRKRRELGEKFVGIAEEAVAIAQASSTTIP